MKEKAYMNCRKVISVILCLVIVFSTIAIPVSADEVDTITVHYYNENNWSNPYIYYYYGGNTGASWPGNAMSFEGDGWYSYTIYNYSTAYVIFSDNGSNQNPAQNEQGFQVSDEMWYYKGSWSTEMPENVYTTVHYYNENNWSTPYIYYYTDNNNPVSWPGNAMVSEGGNWYTFTISDLANPKVIFSDNGSNQNPAQNQPGFDVSGEKWYLNGTFYDSEPEGITVHFHNYNNWNNVNIYYYDGERTGNNWTGNPMISDGDGWYTYKIYGFDSVKVLFNNGGNIQIPGQYEPGFDVSGEMWYRNGEWTTERPDEITVYFYKPDNWDIPNIYYYKDDYDTGPAWPGEPMRSEGDNWYSFTITKYDEAKVIFNSISNQIPAQNQPGLDATGVMRYKDGNWYEDNDDNLDDDIIDFGDIEILLSNGKIEVIFDDNGGIRVIEGKFTEKKVNSTESAADVLNSASSLFGFGFNATADDITVKSLSMDDEIPKYYYRYSPVINGVPVLGSQIVISTDSVGNVNGLFNSYVPKVYNINSHTSISSSEAENIATTEFLLKEDVNQFLSSFVDNDIGTDEVVEAFIHSIDISSDELIYAVDKYELPILVYSVEISCCLSYFDNLSQTDMNLFLDLTYYIYANGENAGNIYKIDDNMQRIISDENLESKSIEAKDLLGNMRSIQCIEKNEEYLLQDIIRNIKTCKTKTTQVLFWKKYSLPGDISDSTNPTAVSAHANFAEAYDYYKEKLGRDSFNDNGADIVISFDYEPLHNNAQWDSKNNQFIIGNEGNLVASLDVIGHEFTHAVISYITKGALKMGLINGGESGALGESYCDIMGNIIEGKINEDFWSIGEDSGDKLRSLSNPSIKNYNDFDYGKNKTHENCGIFNYAIFKMMTDERTKGVLYNKWAKVFYQSLYTLTNTATFIDARGAILCAAKDLGFSHDQQQAIKDAFDEVGIIEPESIRIELTWGENPLDLDSHLVGPSVDGLGRFHVYFGNKTYYSPGNSNRQLYAAELDYDDTNSFGPEVTTIHALTPGNYYFYVHDYSNGSSSTSKAMARSGATVKIYKGSDNVPISTFSVDSNRSGTYWNVFQLFIDQTGEININSIDTYGSIAVLT